MLNQNKLYSETQTVKQLEKRRGGYFYIIIESKIVEGFPEKRKTRLLCTPEEKVTFQCGLNHLGNGDFFIIVSSKNLKSISKGLGERIAFKLQEDPNPLGVAMPEFLEVLLLQDSVLSKKFKNLSMSNKRHIIHSTSKVKDIDIQVKKAIKMIELHSSATKKRKSA